MKVKNVTYNELSNLCWTEDNRIQAMSDRRNGAWYNYDATGERNLKLTGQTMHVNQNGQDYYTPIFDQQTLYANPLITINDKGYTKHYFEEGKRICSKIGSGGLIDIDKKVEGISQGIEEIRDMQKDGVVKTFDMCMQLYPYIKTNNLHKTVVKPYEGQINPDEPIFYYHSDHLGSASFLTDRDGYETQQLVYLPFGEDWVDRKYNTGQYDTPYKFNGKEKDEETGYYNYGARYYYDWASIWLSVDPMSDKYPHLTSYNYCANNPVMLVDPDGREIGETFSKLTGEKIHDDGIKDGKVYVGTKSDGSDREYVGQKSNIPDMTSKFRKQLQKTKSFFEKKNKEFSAKESGVFAGWGKKAYDRLSYFQSEVTDGAEFDLKNKEEFSIKATGEYSFFEGKLFRFDDYGNYNYGVAAKAFGLSETMALFGAGANQTKKALSPTGIMFTPLGFMPVFGKINLMSPSNVKGFFDDPRDTHMINKGYSR